MRAASRKIAATLRLMLYALFPEKGDESKGRQGSQAAPDAALVAGTWRCEAWELRHGVDRFLDERGEFRVVFLNCRGAAAPFVLFRLKRQGFSRCVVKVVEQGLYVEARR